MTSILIGLGVWVLVSIPAALLVGKFIKHGSGEDE